MHCRVCTAPLTGRQTAYCSRTCAQKADYLRNTDAYKARAKQSRLDRVERDPEGLRQYNRERARRLYWSDPDKGRAKARAQYQRNPEPSRAASRAFYWKNPEPYRSRALARIAADPEGHRRYQRDRYYATDPDIRYVRSLVSRLRRLDKIKEYERSIVAKRRIYVITRRLRLRENGGQHTAEEWLSLCNKYGNHCLACGKTEPLTPDHIIPLALGGTSDISNIQPLCLRCNQRKARRVIDYRRFAEVAA